MTGVVATCIGVATAMNASLAVDYAKRKTKSRTERLLIMVVTLAPRAEEDAERNADARAENRGDDQSTAK